MKARPPVAIAIRTWFRLLEFLAVLSLSLFAAGCREQQAPQLPPNVIAQVGDQDLTRAAFELELQRRSRGAPDRYAAPQAKLALLEELIRAEALYQQARAAGYDQDPELIADFKRMLAAKYQEDQLARLAPPQVTAQDIAAYYQRHSDRFGTPEKVRVAMITLNVPRTATRAKRAEAAQRAETILAEATTAQIPDGTFGLLAQTHSDDQVTRYSGGDLGWLRVADPSTPYDPAIAAAIAKLTQPGEFAPVIETATAFYLVRLIERQPAKMRPLTEVQDGIAYRVGREKEQAQQEDFFARAKQGLPIRINHPLLDAIAVAPERTRPPVGPGATTQFRREP
jgi:peptidyl-prolyl cis-trans isomerase C